MAASAPAQNEIFIPDTLVHPADRNLVQSAMTAIVLGGERGRHIDLEYRPARADGATVWISASGTVDQDARGRPIRAMGIARDITARKRAELAQRRADHLVRQIAEVASNPIYVFDLDKGQRVYGNSAYDVLGYGAIGVTEAKAIIAQTIHPEDRERHAAYRRSLSQQADHVVTECEYRLRHADGSWHWFLNRNLVFARKADGSVRQVIGTTTDITTIKRAQEELLRNNADLERRIAERTADLSATNRELETFAYSVSHDLRAPLRAIDAFSSAVLEQYREQLDARAQRYLTRVRTNVHRMGEIIEALLDLSRAGRDVLSLEELDLSELAGSALAELREAEPARQVELIIAPHAKATGDRRLLCIVLANLLGNAWKYTSRREYARIEFGMRVENDEQIFVRDNGSGFDVSTAVTLFMPFQRFHGAEEFAGTGLGLATVQRIISRHGGRIWADSAPDLGATFYWRRCRIPLDERFLGACRT